MDIIEAIEIFALVTGVVYMVLEVLQKNFMWVLGILTGIACAYSFGLRHLYASMGLNIYYVAVSVIGLYKWSRAGKALREENSGKTVHLGRMTTKTLIISALVFVFGSVLLILLLNAIGDSESWLDATVAMMSAVATWWLAKSYPQQWFVWIFADILSAVLCLVSGMYWMCALYVCYTIASVIGYVHWMKNGEYIENA